MSFHKSKDPEKNIKWLCCMLQQSTSSNLLPLACCWYDKHIQKNHKKSLKKKIIIWCKKGQFWLDEKEKFPFICDFPFCATSAFVQTNSFNYPSIVICIKCSLHAAFYNGIDNKRLWNAFDISLNVKHHESPFTTETKNSIKQPRIPNIVWNQEEKRRSGIGK